MCSLLRLFGVLSLETHMTEKASTLYRSRRQAIWLKASLSRRSTCNLSGEVDQMVRQYTTFQLGKYPSLGTESHTLCLDYRLD